MRFVCSFLPAVVIVLYRTVRWTLSRRPFLSTRKGYSIRSFEATQRAILLKFTAVPHSAFRGEQNGAFSQLFAAKVEPPTANEASRDYTANTRSDLSNLLRSIYQSVDFY